MATSRVRNDATVAECTRELVRLRRDIEQARAALLAVRRDIAEAEAHLGSTHAAKLVEVNEQLVVAALRAQTENDTTALALTEATRSAELDALTQLPTRTVMLDRLTQAIAFAKRHGTRLALLFLDLNNFKQINDTLGHAVGDRALRRAAQCFVDSVRAEDTVSRHGGDEFVILLAEVALLADAELVANKVAAALAIPQGGGDHVFGLKASIGISLYPDDGGDAETLIHCADTAMYRAKRQGSGSAVFHSDHWRRKQELASPAPTVGESPVELMRETNERLVIAAVNAQASQAAAELAQRTQTDLLALVANELRKSMALAGTGAADHDGATLRNGFLNQERALQRVTRKPEEIQAEVRRLIRERLDARDDAAKIWIDLPRRLPVPDQDGCNWHMGYLINMNDHATDIAAALMQVKSKWNLESVRSSSHDSFRGEATA